MSATFRTPKVSPLLKSISSFNEQERRFKLDDERCFGNALDQEGGPPNEGQSEEGLDQAQRKLKAHVRFRKGVMSPRASYFRRSQSGHPGLLAPPGTLSESLM